MSPIDCLVHKGRIVSRLRHDSMRKDTASPTFGHVREPFVVRVSILHGTWPWEPEDHPGDLKPQSVRHLQRSQNTGLYGVDAL